MFQEVNSSRYAKLIGDREDRKGLGTIGGNNKNKLGTNHQGLFHNEQLYYLLCNLHLKLVFISTSCKTSNRYPL